jgi:hypothetical protein
MWFGISNWFPRLKISEDERARAMRGRFIKDGMALIKQGMSDEWRAWVTERTEDRYSAKIVDSTIGVMKALSEGKTPEEAEKAMSEQAATPYSIATAVAVAVAYFHPRGEEFSNYWNDEKVVACVEERDSQGTNGDTGRDVYTILAVN